MDAALDDILHYKQEKDEDFYCILGCDELSSKEQILAEYKSRVLSCHPDKHPGDAAKAEEFERIQRAKDVLCDDEKRENYDKWLHAGISMSYRKWCNMRDSVHTSMHWATPRKECMLEHPDGGSGRGTQEQVVMQGKYPPGDLGFIASGSSSRKDTDQPVEWTRDSPSDMLKKFRNYEI